MKRNTKELVYSESNSIIESDFVYSADRFYFGLPEMDSRKNVKEGLLGLKKKCTRYEEQLAEMRSSKRYDKAKAARYEACIEKIKGILAKYPQHVK